MVSKHDRPDRRRPLLTHVLRAQLLVKPAAAAPMRPQFRPRVHHRSAGRDRTASPGAPVGPGCPGGAGPLRTAVRTLRNAATPSGYSDQARRGPFSTRRRSPMGADCGPPASPRGLPCAPACFANNRHYVKSRITLHHSRLHTMIRAGSYEYAKVKFRTFSIADAGPVGQIYLQTCGAGGISARRPVWSWRFGGVVIVGCEVRSAVLIGHGQGDVSDALRELPRYGIETKRQDIVATTRIARPPLPPTE